MNKELTKNLINLQFDSVIDFVSEWELRAETELESFGKARDRKTVYKWLNEGFPLNKNVIFGFSGVLGVDPIAILDFQNSAFLDSFGRERLEILQGSLERSSLFPLWPIYKPSPAWPDKTISLTYYGRQWCVKEFVHNPNKIANEYVAVHMESLDTNSQVPKVYHFSYRRSGALDKSWRPYGSVICHDPINYLISESGETQKVNNPGCFHSPIVETYFGPGAADFRIASLHDFRIINLECPSKQSGVLRFTG